MPVIALTDVAVVALAAVLAVLFYRRFLRSTTFRSLVDDVAHPDDTDGEVIDTLNRTHQAADERADSIDRDLALRQKSAEAIRRARGRY